MGDNTAKSEDWLSKQEVAEFLGVSTKSVQKYVTQGKLSSKYERTKTGDAMFIPRSEVVALKSLHQKTTFRPAVETTLPATLQGAMPVQWLEKDTQSRIMLAVEAFVTRASIPNKLMLTIEEAHNVSGLPKSYLKTAIADGKLEGVKVSRRWLIKRTKLEAFIEAI